MTITSLIDPGVRRERRRTRIAPSSLFGAAIALAAVAFALCATGCGGDEGSTEARPIEIVAPAGFESLHPKLQEYIRHYMDEAKAKPDDAQGHAMLGLVYAANGLWEEALRCFENADRIRSDSPLPLYYEAIAQIMLGETDDAAASLREVVRRFPGFAPAHHRLGSFLLEHGNLDEAEAAFRTTIDLAPSNPEGYVGIGNVEIRRGNPEAAIGPLERAIAIQPRNRLAHYLLGIAYRNQGRTEDAEFELELGKGGGTTYMADPWASIVSRHAMLLDRQGQRAFALLAEGRASEAVSIMEEALRWYPGEALALNNLATLYIQTNQLDKARPLLAQAQALEEHAFGTQYNLAYLALAEGKLDEALAHIDRAIGASPSIGRGYVVKAACLLRMQPPRREEAREVLAEALARDPDNADAALNLGSLLATMGRPEEARSVLLKAVALDPWRPKAHALLGEVCLAMGDVEGARRTLARARRIAPRDPDLEELEKKIAARAK